MDRRRVKKGNAIDTPRIKTLNVETHRIEEASLNAWPAMRQTLLDGWVLRFSRGFTKRSNSIIPLYPARAPDRGDDRNDRRRLLDKIRYCENLYAREQLQTVFRLTDIQETQTEQLVKVLQDRGYQPADPSLVLATELSARVDTQVSPSKSTRIVPIDEWLTAYCTLTGMNEPARSLHRLILNGIGGECAFTVLYVDEAPAACGLAVVEHDLVGLFDIFTHDQLRRRGLAKALVTAMLDWAGNRGARYAYLQVVEQNSSARQLYDQLGFSEVYRYEYLIAP